MYLQKRIERPGVLIEVGFLSNANDRYLLKQKTYQDKVANVITDSMIQYFAGIQFIIKKITHYNDSMFF